MEIKDPMLCIDGKIRYPRYFIPKSALSRGSKSPRKNNFTANLRHVVPNLSSHEKYFQNFPKISQPETSRRVVLPFKGEGHQAPGGGLDASYPSGGTFGLEILEVDSESFQSSLQKFEKSWNLLCEEYYGKTIPFFGKRIRNVKKSIAAYRAVLNAKELKADIELYLRSHFDLAKKNPRVLTPGYLGSKNGIKIFQEWIKKFANKKDALDKACNLDLETLLKQDHKNFLYYKNKANMTPSGIFTMMHRQFTHLYLISHPEFLDLMDRESGGLPPSFVKECRDTLKRLQRNPPDAINFFKLVEEIKCQET